MVVVPTNRSIVFPRSLPKANDAADFTSFEEDKKHSKMAPSRSFCSLKSLKIQNFGYITPQQGAWRRKQRNDAILH